MGVSRLEHVNIRCARLQATRDFYVDLIGLTEGPRPAFPFPGYWLYLGDLPVIHLASMDGAAWSSGGDAAPLQAADTGAFDHVAFRGEDFEGTRTRFAQANYAFRERVVPGGELRQIFIRDPEGVLVELNFHA